VRDRGTISSALVPRLAITNYADDEDWVVVLIQIKTLWRTESETAVTGTRGFIRLTSPNPLGRYSVQVLS
jgi:hypothetical protein